MPSPANRRDLSQYDRTLDGTEEAFISDNERRNQLFREVFNLVLIRDDNSDGLVNQSHVSCRSQSAAQAAQHPDAIIYILYKASVIETMTDTTHPNHNAGEGHYSIRSISLLMQTSGPFDTPLSRCFPTDWKLLGVCVAQSCPNKSELYGEGVAHLHLVGTRGMSTGGSKSICPLMTEGVLESNRVRAIAVEIVLGEPDMKVRRRLWGKLESFGPGVIGRLLPDWDILLCKAESGPYKQATGRQTCISDCLWQCHWSRLNGIWGDLRTSDSVLKKYVYQGH